SSKKTVVKPQAITGFPEYTPMAQRQAQALLARIRSQFELHGFTPIETPAVERLEVLLAKGGDTDKEMYILQRLEAGADDSEAKLGLHYDLTVPFARYVAQNMGSLVFPFKRYQMQPCWRGERPQDGRFRQFLQCDIDVVNVDRLPLSFDADVPLVALEVLHGLNLGSFDLRISNRKILEGFLLGMGFGAEGGVALTPITRFLDKLDKIGRPKVLEGLTGLGISPEDAERCLAIAGIATRDMSFVDQVKALGVTHERLDAGLEELSTVVERLRRDVQDGLLVDLSVTRGLDYYTGSVYEIRWNEYPKLGSIGAGGRYDDLAGNYTNQHLPGVGLSLGFTRIFSKLQADGRLPKVPPTPTQVLVTWLEEDGGLKAQQAARQLRAQGIPTEVYHESGKLTKQLNYAHKKEIPYVYFDADGQIKNMATGEQTAVDLSTWKPN
ncbi:unnamed protein product, partial [Phaeothamnion confervicola]